MQDQTSVKFNVNARAQEIAMASVRWEIDVNVVFVRILQMQLN